MRKHKLTGALGLAATLALPLHAQVDPLQVWTASGGEARLELRADFLPDFGVEVVAEGRAVREVVETRRTLSADDHLVLEAPYGNFGRFVSGSITLDTGWRMRHGEREVQLDGLILTPGIYQNGHPSFEARDSAGRHLLTFSHLHILAEHERGLLTVHNADIHATAQLAALLDLEVLAELPIGMGWLDMSFQVPLGADTSGRGPSCEGRPFWPQEGHEIDVAMIRIQQVAYQGTDGTTGRIKVAPSATLKNVGQGASAGDVPWIPNFSSLGGEHAYPYAPPDQHPFLVWNMYRIAEGRIEQLAGSGVKHAFLSLNQNCDNCGSGNVLWPDCEDVYGTGTNDLNSRQGPREDIEASVGLHFSTCSFFDPGCTGSQTNNSTSFQNRLMVDPGELQTPDAEYFLDAWYVIQYDIDIWNSMAYHRITPTPSGGGWSFGPLGPFSLGRVVDQWVAPDETDPLADHVSIVVPSATPAEPYPGNMPQGHINVLVRATEMSPGRYRYNYAVQNFDFDRGVEALRIPIGDGVEVFETWFGDIDDDPSNDWTVAIEDGFIRFEAPEENPLSWFTLFNFEIEVDAPPVTTQVTLDLGGDAVVPSVELDILGPEPGPAGPAPVLAFDPSSLDFGNVEVGETSLPQSSTLHNTGDADATGLVFSVPGGDFDADTTTCGATLPTDSSCPVLVTFTPVEAGPAEATVQVSSGEGAAANLGLAGNGLAPPQPALAFEPASLDFGDVDVGDTSPQQGSSLHNTGGDNATMLTFGEPGGGFDADTTTCGDSLPAGESCPVMVTFTPSEAGPAVAVLEVHSDEGAAASLGLAGHGLAEGAGFTAIALEVDPDGLTSDGNRVLEPGELVVVAPAWRNDDTTTRSLEGTAADFTGPDGADYLPLLAAAQYGDVGPGETASCLDGGACYQLGVTNPAVRPATHWEATFEETLSNETTKTWTVHIGESFLDVPKASPFYRSVETLLHVQVTGGCSDSEYCPTAENTRGQMPVFVLRAHEGGDYTPPACVEGEEAFADVPATSGLCPWIQELSERGVVAGCGGSNYCPDDPVNRQQMAIFLVRTIEGPDYTPPACMGEFADVPCSSPFAAWIEDLFDRGVTGGCGTEPLVYCPTAPVNRQQMAAFVSAAFGLQLYGP